MSLQNRNLLVGKIDIFKNFSFFEVEEAHDNLILKSFIEKNGMVKNCC